MSAGFALGLPILLLAAALLLPWLLLPLLAAKHVETRARLLPLAPLPALAVALSVPEGTALALPVLPAGLAFGVDATARAFLLPAALIWALSGWMAGRLRPEQAGAPTFAALWLLALAGNLVAILAQDVLALYAGIALMTFAALGLVVFERTAEAFAAGRLYLAMMMLAEIALFLAVAALVAAAAGETHFDAVALALAVGSSGPILTLLALAFGLKLGAMGLHAWLPRAHPVAPVPASAVLSGVMIKAGMLGWLRLVAPAGDDFAPMLAPLLVALGLVGAFYAVLRGLSARDPKVLLGWSSVSQMGLFTILAGLVLPSGPAKEAAGAAIAVLVMHHGLAKAALFLGVGLLAASTGRRRLWVWLGLWLPALALAAAPGTSGVLAKVALDVAAGAAGAGPSLAALMELTNVTSALLMLRLLWLTRPDMVPERGAVRMAGRAPALPWVLLLLGVLVLPWVWFRATPLVAEAMAPSTQFGALLAPLAALLIGLTALRWPPRARLAWRRRRYRWLASRPPAAWTIRLPTALQLATWERHLHGWRLIGQLVVLLTLALAAVIGHGLTVAP
ncbi:MAG: hypothetical protein EA356_16990 [Geminicoccaceae bacterium]|nr:MAG: hypothetical protein EA356_16990 [Geminicoccaceae bacterium]